MKPVSAVQRGRPLLCLLILAVAAAMAACSQPLTVEQQIVTVIRDMEARIEEGERRPFMAHVSENFSGQDSLGNRDQLNAMILYQLNRHKRVQAKLFGIRVTPTAEGEAEAYFRVLLTGGEGWLPESGQMYSMVTTWREEEDDWKLVSARWKPVVIEVPLE